MDIVKEMLEFDPLAYAERALGNKHWSEFSDDEMMSSMGLAFLHNDRKDKMLKKNHDTHFDMDWNEFEKIVTSNGFKIGYEEKFSYEDH